MTEEISDVITQKIKDSVKDENEQNLILELLAKTGKYDKQTKPLSIKKEFQLLVDQYFPFKEENNE